MNIRPLHDRVVIRRKPAEEKSPGGIIIPENAKQPLYEGTVVHVGNGKMLEDGTVRPPDVKVGDQVLFGKYTGTEIGDPNGDRLLVLKEDDLLAVVE